MNVTDYQLNFSAESMGAVTTMTDLDVIMNYCNQISWSIMIYYIMFFIVANILLWAWLYDKLDEKQYIRFVTMFLRIFCFATALMLLQTLLRLF